jgi:hypothetical protein
MIKSTPHPPSTRAPQDLLIHYDLGTPSLFTVKPNVRIEDALVLASEYLCCAAATAYEVADNSSSEFRPLARSVGHEIEAAKALVDASVAGLGTQDQTR